MWLSQCKIQSSDAKKHNQSYIKSYVTSRELTYAFIIMNLKYQCRKKKIGKQKVILKEAWVKHVGLHLSVSTCFFCPKWAEPGYKSEPEIFQGQLGPVSHELLNLRKLCGCTARANSNTILISLCFITIMFFFLVLDHFKLHREKINCNMHLLVQVTFARILEHRFNMNYQR